MRVAIPSLLLSLVAAGCGSSAIEGTLAWSGSPVVSGRSLHGVFRNTTSHSVSVDGHAMRLLDGRGQKVSARIRIAASSVPAHGNVAVSATWKSGKPVRIDYGSGTLALVSG